MKFDIVKDIGGIDASIEALDVLRQHAVCCDRWEMQDIFGKGRASRKVVERKLALSSSGGEKSFNLAELESALEAELVKNLTTIGDRHKVVYNEPTQLPKPLFGASPSPFWESSAKLIVKIERFGKIDYVVGEYHWSKCGGKDQFRLTGYNGYFDDLVRGWAYL